MQFKIEEGSKVDVIHETNYGGNILEKTYSLAPLLEGDIDNVYDNLYDAIDFAVSTSVLDFDHDDIYNFYTIEDSNDTMRSAFSVYVNYGPRGYVASEPDSSDLRLEFYLFLKKYYLLDKELTEEYESVL